eukprot:CAMPEP_0178989690 /NCGR_PEP_ID=MMETSP0795-20121207/4521_1 /TAXON_ID=88552 /ORGANISM="Amoebophrya sp., Strain Ameob2" /LENGTH=138 /DNA_ID=CAMNT_0020681133 /DNA_START=139 /DNA_END=556 /DNA_ORIENTATION=+
MIFSRFPLPDYFSGFCEDLEVDDGFGRITGVLAPEVLTSVAVVVGDEVGRRVGPREPPLPLRFPVGGSVLGVVVRVGVYRENLAELPVQLVHVAFVLVEACRGLRQEPCLPQATGAEMDEAGDDISTLVFCSDDTCGS